MYGIKETLIQEIENIVGLASDNYPIKPIVQFYPEEDSFSFYFYIRTNSYSYSNERTDLHEVLSVLFSIFLRLHSGFSSTLVDMENDFTHIPTELYARFLFIEQPQGHKYPLDNLAVDVVAQAILALTHFPCWLKECLEWVELSNDYRPESILWDKDNNYPESSSWKKAEEWAQPIFRVLKLSEDSEKAQFMSRVNPTWMHFRRIRPRISVIKVPGIVYSIHEAVKSEKLWDVVRSNNRLLFISDLSKNSVGLSDLTLAKKIFRGCEVNKSKLDPLIIPLSNYLVAVGESHLVIINRDCGRKRFEIDREQVKQNFAETVSILFPSPAFEWSNSINDDDFEQLILTLLARDPQINWVRKVGSTRDRDGGRDLIAEWVTLPLPGEVLQKGESPVSIRRVVVQCKAYGRPVDKSKVIDIRDVVEHHGATGYFLAVSSSLTSGMFDHLDRLRLGGKIWVDWWTRHEIEERLQCHPDIVSKFPDMVRAKS